MTTAEVSYQCRRTAFNRMKVARGCDHCKGKHFLAHQLSFHHRDPRTKLFEVNLANIRRNPARFQREQDKCDLLCHACHLRADRNLRSRGRPRSHGRGRYAPNPNEKQREFDLRVDPEPFEADPE